MSQQPVEANVVLTADNSQYDASMQASAQQTQQMGKQVDSLSDKMERLTKSAGKKLFGIAAADVAVITAATTAYGAFERQMSSLHAQAAILTTSMAEQKNTMEDYVHSVNDLRTSFGTSTQEAAALVQTLSKMGDNTVGVNKLATSFTKLGNATGESSVNLAQSMLQLQRSMGTPQRETDKFNNQLAVLSANSTASAQSILNFSQQLAPVGRMVGMSQTDIMGVSSAFQKAGQDGYQAANVFSKMMSDVAYASQTGSPDLAKYANLVGMTVGQFKELGGTDQFVKIFDSINQLGPQAITTLNRMGLDGMRTVRTVSAMAQQSGGITEALNQARNADPNALNRGSKAGTDTMAHELQKIRAELAMTAEALGSNFAGPTKKFLSVINTIAYEVHAATATFGPMIAAVMALAAPFAAVAGAIMLASKALTTFALLNAALRNSATFGFNEGRKGMAEKGFVVPSGPRGQEIFAEDKKGRTGNFIARSMYRRGATVGRLFQAEEGMAGPAWLSSGAGWAVKGAGAAGGGAARLGASFFYSGGTVRGLDNVNGRDPFFKSTTAREAWANNPVSSWRSRVREEEGEPKTRAERLRAWAAGKTAEEEVRNAPAGTHTNPERLAGAVGTFSRNMDDANKSTMTFARGLREGTGSLVTGMAVLKRDLFSSAGGAGILAGRAIGGVANFGKDLVMGNPIMMGMLGAMAIGGLVHASNQELGKNITPDNSGQLNPYLQAGGLTPAATFTPTIGAMTSNPTLNDAYVVSASDNLAATSSNYKYSNPKIKGMDAKAAMTMLAPQYSLMKNNTGAVSALSLDLTAEYGQGPATKMLEELRAGQGYHPESIVNAALNQHSAGLMSDIFHNGDENHTKVSEQWADLMGAYSSREDYVNQTRGALAATRQKGNDFGDAAFRVANQAGANFNPALKYDPTTNTNTYSGADPNGTERMTFMKNLFQHMGIKLNDDQAKALRIDPNATSVAGGRRGVVESVFKDGDKKTQEQVVDKFNVSRELLKTPEKAADEVIKKMMGQGIVMGGPGLDQRLSYMEGGSVFGTSAVKKAISQPENMNAQFDAADKMIKSLADMGKTAPQIVQMLGQFKGTVADDADQRYVLASQAQQRVQRYQNFQMPTLSRTDQFHNQVQMFSAAYNGANTDTKHGREIQQGAEDTFAAQAEDQRQYFIGLLYQQREYDVQKKRNEEDFQVSRDRMDTQYNLSRTRALQDFHQQEKWAEEDYQRSRKRAEEDFALQQQRSAFNYHLSVARAYEAFNLQRKRSEEDFQHSVLQMTKQTALTAADIYQRTPVQRTSSAQWLAVNAQDQLKQFKDQEAQLQTLRNRGLSDNAIQQLKLTDPNNAQQLARFVSDTASDPKIIDTFNKAIGERLKAAKALTTDESSSTWQEFNRQFRLSAARGRQDFDIQIRQGHDDYIRGMRQMEDDQHKMMQRGADDFEMGQGRNRHQFHLSMTRAEDDYHTTIDNMVTDYNKAMNHAAQDLERSTHTIDGNFEQILNRATKGLGGHARKMAQAVLGEFTDLKKSTDPAAIAIMQSLAKIFGIDYTPPKVHHDKQTNQAANIHSQIADLNHAEGGVLPGWTPGSDVHHFYSPTAGGLHLSGGEAIMRPEWTKAVGGEKAVAQMNHAAKHGQAFADGGIIGRVPAAQNWARSQVGKPYEWSHVGPSGYDCSGFMSAITNFLRGMPIHSRVGSTGSFPWPGFLPGPGAFTIGSTPRYPGSSVGHMAGTLGGLNVESRGGVGVIVGAGARGYMDHGFSQVYHLGPGGNFGYGGAAGGLKAEVGSKRYTQVEKAVARMAAIHPLADGQMSKIINQFAVKKYNALVAKHGDPQEAPMGALASALGMMGDVGLDSVDIGNATGNRAVWNALTSSGMSEAQAAGVMGNMLKESSLDPHRVQGGGDSLNPNQGAHVGYGLVQWTPGTKLSAYIGNKQPSIANEVGALQQQLHGLGRFPEAAAGNRLRAARTPESAAEAFLVGYERPKDSNQPDRGVAAREFYSRFASKHGDGAIFAQGMANINVGERGPEMVLPLNERGVNFIEALMQKSQAGTEGRGVNTTGSTPMGAAHIYNNYRIDKSTNFSGPITVEAKNPADLANQLRHRARTAALTQPALGGTRI